MLNLAAVEREAARAPFEFTGLDGTVYRLPHLADLTIGQRGPSALQRNDPCTSAPIRYSRVRAYRPVDRDLRGIDRRTHCSTHLTPGSGSGAARLAVEHDRASAPGP